MPRDKMSVSFPEDEDLNLANEAGESNDPSGLPEPIQRGRLLALLMGGQRTLTWFLPLGLASTLAGEESPAFRRDSDGGPERCFSPYSPQESPAPTAPIHHDLLFFKTLYDLLAICLKIAFPLWSSNFLFNSSTAQYPSRQLEWESLTPGLVCILHRGWHRVSAR